MADTATIIDAVAAIGLTVDGIKDTAIYGPGSGNVDGVRELPEDIGVALPAFLMLEGEADIIPGSWERQTWTLAGSVWVEYLPRGERYRQLVNMREPIQAAFRAHSKGGLADAAVQSVLLTGFGQIAGRQWNRGTPDQPGAWFLVLPFSVEVKVNRAVAYQPA